MNRRIKAFKRIIALGLACSMLSSVNVGAVTYRQLEEQKQEAEREKRNAESNLSSVQESIDSIEDEAAALEEEIAALDDLLFDMILEVNLIQSDIDDKDAEIIQTQAEYDLAVEQVNKQQEAMNKRIKYMYEKGNRTYMELLLESKSMAEAVNKVEYTEKLYKYDRVMLENFQLAKQEVADKGAQLQIERTELEEIEEDLKIQEASLNALIEEKQATVENFQDQLANAKAKAASYEKQIKDQSDKLKQINAQEQAKLAEEARKKAEAEAKKKAEEAAKKKLAEDEANKKLAEELAKATNSNNASTTTDNITTEETGAAQTDKVEEVKPQEETAPAKGTSVTATGSGLGTDIANYGLQFVGNPYVAGGTSLTNGADCSGFTQAVYSHFGISIPRSSYSQSEGGTPIEYSNIQAGDIIYYGGHVAIYIGNNQIVHASTAATGIKVSNAFYRSIITIRRYY